MNDQKAHRMQLPTHDPKLEQVMLTGPDLRRMWQLVTKRRLKETHRTTQTAEARDTGRRLPPPDPRLEYVMHTGPDFRRIAKTVRCLLGRKVGG